jgi:hypothetical protein
MARPADPARVLVTCSENTRLQLLRKYGYRTIANIARALPHTKPYDRSCEGFPSYPTTALSCLQMTLVVS